ncbi:unnamed protein product [Malus baccata var. baccata]
MEWFSILQNYNWMHTMPHLATTYAAVNARITLGDDEAFSSINRWSVSAESSDESSDDSKDDDETPAKVTAQKACSTAKKGPSVAVKKADTSSSGSEESSESQDEVCAHA